MSKTITFIGAGNMPRSLVSGLTKEEMQYNIRLSDPNPEQLQGIQKYWPTVETFTDNIEAIKGADVVILAVKPQIMELVCEPLQTIIQSENPLIISIAAGITIGNISTWLDDANASIVRCMPNTPSLVQSGMTGLFANSAVSSEQSNLAESILRAVGSTLWLSTEESLNAVTAVSGSGPAYYFLVMEAMQNAAQELGLSAEDARLLVLQTAFGAAKLALESSDDAGVLRQRVTSKGGTTEAALNKLIGGGLPALFEEAMVAATIRSKELSQL
ncbi:MAG: pyrroline-5-carboxylate reductase [Cocleimonas sp.]|jgi:pyrroline-5-carboxylate reductase